jgi:hypothetical protein
VVRGRRSIQYNVNSTFQCDPQLVRQHGGGQPCFAMPHSSRFSRLTRQPPRARQLSEIPPIAFSIGRRVVRRRALIRQQL